MAINEDEIIDPEAVRKLTEELNNSKFIMDPHGRSGVKELERPIARERYREEFGVATSINHIINHCRSNGSGMSGCYACQTYNKDGEKIQCQKACNFFQKHSFAARCRWETYGEYCWSTKAQDELKKRGF
jgi:hypothetical protein